MTNKIMTYGILLGLLSGCGVAFGMELEKPSEKLTVQNVRGNDIERPHRNFVCSLESIKKKDDETFSLFLKEKSSKYPHIIEIPEAKISSYQHQCDDLLYTEFDCVDTKNNPKAFSVDNGNLKKCLAQANQDYEAAKERAAQKLREKDDATEKAFAERLKQQELETQKALQNELNFLEKTRAERNAELEQLQNQGNRARQEAQEKAARIQKEKEARILQQETELSKTLEDELGAVNTIEAVAVGVGYNSEPFTYSLLSIEEQDPEIAGIVIKLGHKRSDQSETSIVRLLVTKEDIELFKKATGAMRKIRLETSIIKSPIFIYPTPATETALQDFLNPEDNESRNNEITVPEADLSRTGEAEGSPEEFTSPTSPQTVVSPRFEGTTPDLSQPTLEQPEPTFQNPEKDESKLDEVTPPQTDLPLFASETFKIVGTKRYDAILEFCKKDELLLLTFKEDERQQYPTITLNNETPGNDHPSRTYRVTREHLDTIYTLLNGIMSPAHDCVLSVTIPAESIKMLKAIKNAPQSTDKQPAPTQQPASENQQPDAPANPEEVASTPDKTTIAQVDLPLNVSKPQGLKITRSQFDRIFDICAGAHQISSSEQLLYKLTIHTPSNTEKPLSDAFVTAEQRDEIFAILQEKQDLSDSPLLTDKFIIIPKANPVDTAAKPTSPRGHATKSVENPEIPATPFSITTAEQLEKIINICLQNDYGSPKLTYALPYQITIDSDLERSYNVTLEQLYDICNILSQSTGTENPLLHNKTISIPAQAIKAINSSLFIPSQDKLVGDIKTTKCLIVDIAYDNAGQLTITLASKGKNKKFYLAKSTLNLINTQIQQDKPAHLDAKNHIIEILPGQTDKQQLDYLGKFSRHYASETLESKRNFIITNVAKAPTQVSQTYPIYQVVATGSLSNKDDVMIKPCILKCNSTQQDEHNRNFEISIDQLETLIDIFDQGNEKAQLTTTEGIVVTIDCTQLAKTVLGDKYKALQQRPETKLATQEPRKEVKKAVTNKGEKPAIKSTSQLPMKNELPAILSVDPVATDLSHTDRLWQVHGQICKNENANDSYILPILSGNGIHKLSTDLANLEKINASFLTSNIVACKTNDHTFFINKTVSTIQALNAFFDKPAAAPEVKKAPSASYFKPFLGGVTLVGILAYVLTYKFDSLPLSMQEMLSSFSATLIGMKNKILPA